MQYLRLHFNDDEILNPIALDPFRHLDLTSCTVHKKVNSYWTVEGYCEYSDIHMERLHLHINKSVTVHIGRTDIFGILDHKRDKHRYYGVLCEYDVVYTQDKNSLQLKFIVRHRSYLLLHGYDTKVYKPYDTKHLFEMICEKAKVKVEYHNLDCIELINAEQRYTIQYKESDLNFLNRKVDAVLASWVPEYYSDKIHISSYKHLADIFRSGERIEELLGFKKIHIPWLTMIENAAKANINHNLIQHNGMQKRFSSNGFDFIFPRAQLFVEDTKHLLLDIFQHKPKVHDVLNYQNIDYGFRKVNYRADTRNVERSINLIFFGHYGCIKDVILDIYKQFELFDIIKINHGIILSILDKHEYIVTELKEHYSSNDKVQFQVEVIGINRNQYPTVEFEQPQTSFEPFSIEGDEEISINELHRTRGHFHFDRHNEIIEIDVSQLYAYSNSGTMFSPRRGSIYLVGFINNEPDRPFLGPAMYNGDYDYRDFLKTKYGMRITTVHDRERESHVLINSDPEEECIDVLAQKSINVRVRDRDINILMEDYIDKTGNILIDIPKRGIIWKRINKGESRTHIDEGIIEERIRLGDNKTKIEEGKIVNEIVKTGEIHNLVREGEIRYRVDSGIININIVEGEKRIKIDTGKYSIDVSDEICVKTLVEKHDALLFSVKGDKIKLEALDIELEGVRISLKAAEEIVIESPRIVQRGLEIVNEADLVSVKALDINNEALNISNKGLEIANICLNMRNEAMAIENICTMFDIDALCIDIAAIEICIESVEMTVLCVMYTLLCTMNIQIHMMLMLTGVGPNVITGLMFYNACDIHGVSMLCGGLI